MPTTIKLKNSVTTTNAPSSLAQGEVAINITDKKVWVGNAATTPIQLLGDGGSVTFTSLTVTGVSTFSAGTVSAPSITTSGDTNTGIYFPVADTIAFTEGGVESMRIDSSGNLGLGATSPLARLDVVSGNSTNKNRIRNSTGNEAFLMFQNSDTGTSTTDGFIVGISSTEEAYLWNQENQPILFATNNTERMRISSDGYVGIGTNSPRAPLAFAATASTAGVPNKIRLFDDGASNLYGFNVSSGLLDIIAGSFGGVAFYTNGANERMRIDSSGNVGIGTNSPQASLHVAGTIGGSPTGNGMLAGMDGNNACIQLNGSDGAIIDFSASGVNRNGRLLYNNASNYLAIDVNQAERMRIDSSGRLLVGTTSSSGTISTFFGSQQSVIIRNGLNDYNELGVWNGTSDNNKVQIKVDSAGGQIGMRSNDAIRFSTNDTERMRITSGGDLLVGNTTAAGRVFAAATGANQDMFFAWANNASYAAADAVLTSSRSASTSYTFLFAISNRPAPTDGTGQDIEFQMRGDGNAYADGTWNNNGADYAEYFESATGQAISVGSTVVLENNKVRLATASDNADDVIGVVRPKEPSKASMVVGNTAWNKWANKYLTDDFDRYIMEDHDVVEWDDEDGKEHSYESHNIPKDVVVPADAVIKTHDEKGNKFQHYKLNPEWNSDAEYVNRENRDEWLIIGLVGQVKVLKGQKMGSRWVKMRDVSNNVEEWFIR